jgi:hypothetical protein
MVSQWVNACACTWLQDQGNGCHIEAKNRRNRGKQQMGQSVGPLNLGDVSISPRFRKSNWQNAVDQDDWTKRVEIFEDRIEGRFLKPVRLIADDNELCEFAGFSILALDCLIVETLNQFYSGIDETTGNHSKAFWEFFKKSPFFKDHFSKKTAEIFYSHFRCGLLHQAQTKKKSVVRMDQDAMIQPVDNDDVSLGLIVDRTKFHEALENEIADYRKKLIVGGEENAELRDNFVKKMNIICGI